MGGKGGGCGTIILGGMRRASRDHQGHAYKLGRGLNIDHQGHLEGGLWFLTFRAGTKTDPIL